MDEVRVGIVGSRFAAELHAKAFARCPAARVVAVASKTEESARAFARAHAIPDAYGDYRKMLERTDLDLVSICVPNHLHCELALACARARVHMICEKPLATSVDDGRKMLAAARDAGVQLLYAEDWIFAPALVRARDIVEEGALGDLLYLKGKETHSGTHSPYAQSRETCGGGALIHLAVHPVGWACAMKKPHCVVEVSGTTSQGADGNLKHKHYGGEDWAVATLTFSDGTRALVEGNYITVGGLDDVVELYGTTGTLKINLSQGSPISAYSEVGFAYAVEKADTTKGWTRPAVDEEQSLGYYDEIAHFVECVLGESEPATGVRACDGLEALVLCDAIYRSAAAGRVVRIQE